MFKSMTKDHKKKLLELILVGLTSLTLALVSGAGHNHGGRVNYAILATYIILYLAAAREVLVAAFEGVKRGQALDENFLMTIATVTAFFIGEYLEAIAVMVFYGFGELFEEIATHRSKENIKELLDLVPDLANRVKEDGSIEQIDLDDVEVGDILIARDGEKIGVDGVIIEGSCLVDTSSVTGESMPVELEEGSEIISSSVLIQGIIKYRAEKEFDDSIAAKIIELIEDSQMSKSTSEKMITRFARVYTPIVVSIALLVGIIPPLFLNGAWSDYLFRAATFLVLSCPCALVLSVPLSFMSGLGLASREGILIKGSQYFEELNKAEILLTDKTGTLTTGEFIIKDIEYFTSYNKEKILDYIYNLEKMSTHPIGAGIVKSLDREENPDLFESITNEKGLGIRAKTKDEEEIKIGSAKYLGLDTDTVEKSVYISIDNELVARIIIDDQIKDKAKETIAFLKKDFEKISLLSGDSQKPVADLAQKLDISDYKSNLMPNDKLEVLTSYQKAGKKTVFVGDGINDAPVIKKADVGISMGEGASDLAIESSDILIASGEFFQLEKLMKIAKLTNKTVIENITFIMTVKILILILGLFGYASMWLAIIGDVGVSIIAILWSMRILKKKL